MDIKIIYPGRQLAGEQTLVKETTRRINENARRLCRGGIDPSYIKKTLTKSHVIIYAEHDLGLTPKTQQPRTVKGHRTEIIGFVSIVDLTPETFYVQLVCVQSSSPVPKLGILLMDAVKELARKRTKKYVTLDALPNVILFYRRLGFVNMNLKCIDIPGLAEMIDPFMQSKTVFRTEADVMKNQEYVNVLQMLVNNRLVRDIYCTTVAECNNIGYMMTWCVDQPQPQQERAMSSATAVSVGLSKPPSLPKHGKSRETAIEILSSGSETESDDMW